MTQESPSPGELVHYGVKGMKWGVRKAVSTREVYGARARLQVKQNEFASQKRKVRKAKSPTAKANAETKLNKLKVDFLNDPDRVTAARLSTGEKVVATILAGPVGVGAVGVASYTSRVIDARQRTGYYNK
jgi:hypothetical protein